MHAEDLIRIVLVYEIDKTEGVNPFPNFPSIKVESSQNMIRIVGLSATLPNYLDVANFLRVNLHQGLFFFDGRFRPVPLAQSFVGVKAHNKMKALREMDEVCYNKVLHNVRKGYQVSRGLLLT